MTQSPRKQDSSVRFEPVAYDRSIRVEGGEFVVTLREDDETMEFRKHSLTEAQRLMEQFPPEVYEGPDPPGSVFTHLRETG